MISLISLEYKFVVEPVICLSSDPIGENICEFHEEVWEGEDFAAVDTKIQTHGRNHIEEEEREHEEQPSPDEFRSKSQQSMPSSEGSSVSKSNDSDEEK